MATQKQHLIQLFRNNHNHLSLGQILNTTLAAEYRARMTDLRKEGFIIVCKKGFRPSENLYTLIEPEANGQMRLA